MPRTLVGAPALLHGDIYRVGPKRRGARVNAGRRGKSSARPALTAIYAVNAATPAEILARPALTGEPPPQRAHPLNARR
jgi:hypothetical protein